MKKKFPYMADVTKAEERRIAELLQYERKLWKSGLQRIAGVDEAGRGPLAGPVVAAAVIFLPDVFLPGIDDSKRLPPELRRELCALILQKAISVGIGIVSEKEIDRINIYQASVKAMSLALTQLDVEPDHVLVDGRGRLQTPFPQTTIVRGDGLCFSIAAASIVAKVTRDQLMLEYDRLYPRYGFARHKGYPTREHINAIKRYGLCSIHRRSFHIASEGHGASKSP